MAELDRFAPAYIPQWQRPSNQPQEIFVPLLQPPPIDLISYIFPLFPQPLLKEFSENDEARSRKCIEAHQKLLGVSSKSNHQSLPATPNGASESHDSPNGTILTVRPSPERTLPAPNSDPLSALPPLSPTSYGIRWLSLQFVEHNFRIQTLSSSTLFSVPLVPMPPTSPNIPPLFTLSAPAIRENHPPIALNDSVYLRQLRPWMHSFQGLVFEAVVYSIERRWGSIILRCDELIRPGNWESGLFNVQWSPQLRPFNAINHALEFVGTEVMESKKDSTAMRWLFPEESHLKIDEVHNGAGKNGADIIVHTKWVDKDLNVEQMLAVVSIVHGSHPIPYLISGPPGTGKTKTLVEATLQILRNHPGAHVLVCGASNPSADTLANRLGQHLEPDVMLRLNDPSRPIDEVRMELRRWCWTEDGQRWTLPPLKTLLSKKVIVTSCLDSSLLFVSRCTNTHLSTLLHHTLSHIHPHSVPLIPFRPHFQFLLVDEAAQASEPELCIPLAVMLPPSSIPSVSFPSPTIVICGDQNQLGPRIENAECRKENMDISLLERLFERKVYKCHAFARGNMKLKKKKKLMTNGHMNGKIEWDREGDIGVPFCNLKKNYRSHPVILMLPSTLFYNDTLIPSAPASIQHTPLAHWTALSHTRPNFPLLFLSSSPSKENWIEEGASWFNDGEVDIVEDVIRALLNRDPRPGGTNKRDWKLYGKQTFGVRVEDISVITPFREQVWKIRVALRKIGLGGVDVGDVESLQGAENRIVIISTVRSSKRFIPQDQQLNRGLIFERKRFNVAITRAKELLVIIGNPLVLAEDPWWRSLLELTLRHGAYRGPAIPPNIIDPYSGDTISELEEKFVNGMNLGGGGGDEEENGMVVAGSVIRDTLKEEEGS